MKTIVLSGLLLVVSGCGSWHVDSQMAAGEWKIELQTPPCASDGNNPTHNLQVIWPAHSGEPMTVECDAMPVGEK